MNTAKILRKPKLLSTLVFLDLETTGLPSLKFKPEITEICMLAVSRFAVEQCDSPVRVQNKVNLCFFPVKTIQPAAARISGLNRDNLFHQKDFDATAAKLIQLFLMRLDPPICLIAHNGMRFDFPLLRAHLLNVCGPNFQLSDCHNSPVLCADSLPMFQALNRLITPKQLPDDSGYDSFDTQPQPHQQPEEFPLAQSSPKKLSSTSTNEKPSFHLGDLHRRVFGSVHVNAHNAEADCFAVLNLVQHIALPAIDWMQVNYVEFDQIRPTFTSSDASPISTDPGDFPYTRSVGDNSGANETNKAASQLDELKITSDI